MIAGVDVAVVLERGPEAAGRGMDAEEMAAEIGLERHVEELHEHFADVAPHPFLENVDEKASVLLAPDRAVGHEIAGLGVEKALARAVIAPALVGDRERLGRRPLDDRDELHPFGAELVAEEAVDLSAMLLVGGVDGAQDVELDPVLAKKAPPAHHEVEGALTLPVAPIGVMQFARPVDAETHEEVVLLEEGAPGVVKEKAVGLERLLNRLTGPLVFFDELDRALEKLDLHQRRLAALPGDRHFGGAMGFEELPDIALERLRRHPVLVIGIERLLRQKEAVGAVDVARRSAGFRKKVEGRRRPDRARCSRRRRLRFHGDPLSKNCPKVTLR